MSTCLARATCSAAGEFTIVDYDGRASVELVGDQFHVSGGDRVYSVGLYSYRGLVSAIADRLIAAWRPRGEYPPRWLRAWKLEKTRRIFGRQIHAEWVRLLEQVDPTVLAVQRAIFAATLDRAATPLPAEAYADEHIVRDVVMYRAAAVVASRLAALTETLHREHLEQVSRRIQESEGLRRLAEAHGVQAEMLRVVPARGGFDFPPPAPPPAYVPGPVVPASLAAPALADPDIDVLRDWRGTLSYTGEAYRSLNRTLDRLPGAIPIALVLRLREVALERPITQRLELLALLHATAADRYRARNLPVFMHAKAEQIRRAAQLLIESNRWGEMPLRRSANVKQIVQYIQDYPDEHTGNIVGLAEKSLRWHRDRQDEERRRVIEQLGGDRETARPPVDLPSVEGVTFLATVGEVAEEGARMDHCLASYAREAVAGHCFLFHVEHGGEAASVQVDHKGNVVRRSGHETEETPLRNGASAHCRGGAVSFRPRRSCVRYLPSKPRRLCRPSHSLRRCPTGATSTSTPGSKP